MENGNKTIISSNQAVSLAVVKKALTKMLMIYLMIVVLIGFYALFGALLHFAEGVIRVPSSNETGRNGARPRR